MKRIATAAVLVAMAALCVSDARTAPTPSEVPVTWEISIRLDTPKPIQVRPPGKDKVQTCWYLRYTVTNKTGGDRTFFPSFVLYTDTGEMLRAGRKVPPNAFDEIKKLYNDPLLEDMSAMTGKLLQGEDQAKSGVAIWRDFDPKAGSFDVFIGGLSGENVEIKLPRPIQVTRLNEMTGAKTVVETDLVTLTKTMQLTYRVSAGAAARPTAGVKLVKKGWVMR